MISRKVVKGTIIEKLILYVDSHTLNRKRVEKTILTDKRVEHPIKMLELREKVIVKVYITTIRFPSEEER